tara:strand:- start:1730 stop:1951 length:222 start_codon:yes stop_codon:yes gene_type:complete
MNKLGGYITKLMTIVVDKNQEQFVQDLALSELEKLNVNVNEFIKKHQKDIFDKKQEETEKQLLQEDKKNVKDK